MSTDWLGGAIPGNAGEKSPLNAHPEPLRSPFPLAGGDALKPDPLNDDIAAISEAIREFAVAFNEGNLQKFMDVFSEDFVSMDMAATRYWGKKR